MKKTVWERITILNKHYGITMGELSKRAGLSRSTLPRKEPTDYYPRMSTLSKICEVYNITIAQFFEEDDDFNNTINLVQFNRVTAMLAQLDERKRNIMLNILQERDPKKYWEKCYMLVQTFDKSGKYSSFEDYLEKHNVKL